MTTVELTRFRMNPDQVADLLAAHSKMLADFAADLDGFLDARLVRLSDDEWLDVLTWDTPEDLAASRAKGPDLPGVAAFYATVGDVISDEDGELETGAEPVAPVVIPGHAADLARHVDGPVLLPADGGYAGECATYNLNRVLEPALAVGATCEADVCAAVRFAAAHSLPVAVKATGHQVVLPGHGALLISTGRMNGVTVDPDRRIVRIEAGARARDVVRATAAHGLAPASGSAATVGVVGYTLGGGQSPLLGRSFGYAADHVRELRVVSAEGVSRTVTADSEPDLFWALRGGKGNFGVVTSVDLEAFPVARFYGGGLWYRGEQMADVLHTWRQWVDDLPEEMSSSVAVQRLPGRPELPEPLRGAFVVHLRIGSLGEAEDAERLMAPFRNLATPLFDTIRDRPYSTMAEMHLDPTDPLPYYDRTTCLRELPEKAVDMLVELAGPDSQCPLANVEVRALGGAFDREPAVPNAVSTRGIPFVAFGFGVGGPEQRETMRGHLGRVLDALAPWAADRNMVNFMSGDEATTPEGVRQAYGADRYDRLARVKRTYDPSNMFRMNHNIRPL
ncbi:FAD-binding oxidoreductase [Streptomyces sp. NPDC051644]|uniref:FAD-binding oxidoreductase n=1 Tax=Streptomyces sp. NPDC051644 TaxID=3365666 RepID=UPI0037A5C240